MEKSYFDIGANLTHKSFDKDLEEVLDKSINNGIKKICITSTTIQDTKNAIDLCKNRNDFLFTTVGIHPHLADSFDEEVKNEIINLSSNIHVKAIGETGLDFNRNYSKKENQIFSFLNHIEISNKVKLPLFLHQRESHKTFISCLDEVLPENSCVVHCFTESQKEFYEYLDKGFWIGFTGWICDPKRSSHMNELLKKMPLDRVMIETDSPYLLPKNIKIKGRRNEPMFISEIAERIAFLQNKDLEDLTQIFYRNSLEFFSLQK